MTLRTNKLRELLRKGKPTLGTHVLSSWPTVVEVIGLTNAVDYVEFVSQYAPYDLYALENLARAAELHDLTAMIKIDAEPKAYLAQRAIGSGFQSILFADLRTVKEVEDAIRIVRAEPKGWNGCSNERAEKLVGGGTKEFVRYCDEVVVNIMIEKNSLYEKLEDVMNLDGVDMIQFGPCDFAMSKGLWAQYKNPAIVEAEKRVIKMALKYDKHPRGEIGGSLPEFEKALKWYIKLGVRDFCIGTDTRIIFDWVKDSGKLARESLA